MQIFGYIQKNESDFNFISKSAEDRKSLTGEIYTFSDNKIFCLELSK